MAVISLQSREDHGEGIHTTNHRGPHGAAGGCGPKEAAVHGESIQEYAFPEGLQPMGNTCTRAGERWEREGAAERKHCVLTVTPSNQPLSSRKGEDSGFEQRKEGEKVLVECLPLFLST